MRAQAPNIPVIVRTQDDHALDKLRAAGATEVVPEAIEGSLMLASHALALVGVPMRRVIRIVQDQRDARYNLLRGYFHGADDSAIDDSAQERLTSITLDEGAGVLGRSVADLALLLPDIRVVNLRRRDGKNLSPASELVLQSGDTLVLSGRAELLVMAEDRLLKP